MEKVELFLLLSILAISGAFADRKIIKTTFQNVDEYRALNPYAKLMQMNSFFNTQTNTRSYTLGVRQTGDMVVANSSNRNKWPQPQNVSTTLNYPQPGQQGAFLTYILLNVDQSSYLGSAYVVAGGVQQHFIQIIVQAQVTTYFNYSALFYGFK